MSDQQVNYEFEKWKYEKNLEAANRAFDQHRDFGSKQNEALIRSGEMALRNCFIINGGAVAILLAFVGNLSAKENVHAEIDVLLHATFIFGFGVLLAVVAMALSYFTNYAILAHHDSFKLQFTPPFQVKGPRTSCWFIVTTILRLLTYFVVAASLGSFFFGMYNLQNALHFFSP